MRTDYATLEVALAGARGRDQRSWLMALLLTASAVAVGMAIQIRDGEYYPSALVSVGIGLAFCVAGVGLPRRRMPNWAGATVASALMAALAFQFIQLFRSPPSGWNPWSNDLSRAAPVGAYHAGVLAVALFAAAVALAASRLRQAGFVLLLLTHLGLGFWVIRWSPEPAIDVYHFQQTAAKALLAGENPYAISMPDIYAGTAKEHDRAVYGPGLSREGKLNFGFPYTPLSLLLSTAGYVAAGDHRYAQAVALTAAGALLGYTSGGRRAMLAAAVLLFTPRAFFILGRGWTEPFVALGLASTIFCAVRAPRLLPLALGLFLATKQYLIFALPAVAVLVSPVFEWRPFLSLLARALIVAAIVSLPLALWDVQAFVHSTYTVQKVAPFRTDALSFLVPYASAAHVQPGPAVAFAALVPALALALWRSPRGPAGFAAALAMVYLPFIAFNKQAFANYYFFVIAALCAAIAVAGLQVEPLPDGAEV